MTEESCRLLIKPGDLCQNEGLLKIFCAQNKQKLEKLATEKCISVIGQTEVAFKH
jgi:hypothetical protein